MNLRRANSARRQGAVGFTLIEVLIAIALLGMISLGIYQATIETYRVRDILANEGDFYNSIRLALGILERDVAMLYSPIILKAEKPTPSKENNGGPTSAESAPEIDEPRTSQFWQAATDSRSAKLGMRSMHFIGGENKLSFVAASHVRVYKDAPESDFAQISYELQPSKDPLLPETYVLVRTENPNAFNEENRSDDKNKMKRIYPLLPGVKTMRYRYYRKDKDRWENTWDTDREDFKEIYPDLIEIKIDVIGPMRLNFEGLYKFRPEIPLYGIKPSL